METAQDVGKFVLSVIVLVSQKRWGGLMETVKDVENYAHHVLALELTLKNAVGIMENAKNAINQISLCVTVTLTLKNVLG